MRRIARTPGQRGVSTLELTMAMPLVVFALLLLIGMGHALISKQHAMVGGQFAAHHQRVREAAPSAAAVGAAVSKGSETFRLSGGGDETLSYKATATPRKGLIAQTYQLNASAAQYQTPQVTNACVPHCKPFDAFARILSPELITGIIFSGNSSGLSKDDLLSIVAAKGNKNRKRAPAMAVSPAKKRDKNQESDKPEPPPAGGAGGKTPPGDPPLGGTKTGGTDDGKPGGNGNGNNGRNGNGKPDGNDNGKPGGSGNPAGETDSTRIGKEVHKRKADERRASGRYDAVNSPITDKSGNPILVPRRVDPRTGKPQPGTRSQEAIPDAVNYEKGVIIDDKPAGRPIEKDRQEIIRFNEAFRRREGVYPKRIEIHRYDPNTGELVDIEVYKPEDFLPGNNN
jgi:hypothetical protein